ncbi:MAG: dethiobiotin synthase, partial [Candidatus Binatia bacterium]
TGVGKTFVACGIAGVLRDAGYRIGVMKPVESGCAEIDGKLVPEDAVRLQGASGCQAPLEKICPYPLRDALAPSIAAERQGISIDIDRLMNVYSEISAAHDLTLVEGAGGLMVPLLPSYTYADLAKLLKIPLIVVAANKLGAINHLLLTLEHAACKELPTLGYVLNNLAAAPSPAAETNRDTLSTLTAAVCLGELSFHDATAVGELRALFAEQFDFKVVEAVVRNF